MLYSQQYSPTKLVNLNNLLITRAAILRTPLASRQYSAGQRRQEDKEVAIKTIIRNFNERNKLKAEATYSTRLKSAPTSNIDFNSNKPKLKPTPQIIETLPDRCVNSCLVSTVKIAKEPLLDKRKENDSNKLGKKKKKNPSKQKPTANLSISDATSNEGATNIEQPEVNINSNFESISNINMNVLEDTIYENDSFDEVFELDRSTSKTFLSKIPENEQDTFRSTTNTSPKRRLSIMIKTRSDSISLEQPKVSSFTSVSNSNFSNNRSNSIHNKSSINAAQRRMSRGSILKSYLNNSINFNEEQLTKPKLPRLLANLSKEGQYCLLKAYEDILFNELMKLYPNERIHRAFNLNISKSTNSDSTHSSTTLGGTTNSVSGTSSTLQQMLNESETKSITSAGGNNNEYMEEDDMARKLKTTELVEGAMSILDEIKYLRNNNLLDDYLLTMSNMNSRRSNNLDSSGNLITTSQQSRSNSRPALVESATDLITKYKVWIERFNRELNFYKT